MIKRLLLAGAAILSSSALFAATFQVDLSNAKPSQKPTSKNSGLVKFDGKASVDTPMKTRAGEEGEVKSLDFTYAPQPYTAYYLPNSAKGDIYYEAIEISENNAATFAGDTIKSINITTGCYVLPSGNQSNRISDVTVFIVEGDIESEPVYTQAGKLGLKAFTEYKVDLDTPYEIKGDKALYIGYKFVNTNASNYYLGVYPIYIGPETCWVGKEENGKVTWNNYWDEIGALTLGCTIVGKNMPENGVRLMQVGGDANVEPNTPFGYNFMLLTTGITTEKMQITCKIGDMPLQTADLELTTPAPFNTLGVLPVNSFMSELVELGLPLEFEISTVNGVANSNQDNKATGYINCFPNDKGFQRTFLIEEATGTWCGWCPRGIVMMEYIREKYPELFAAVAIHGDDAMEVESTYDWLVTYADGFPFAMIDREYTVQTMAEDEIDAYVEAMKDKAAPFSISGLTAEIDDNGNLAVEVKTKAAIDCDNNNAYRIGFYLSEDGVGPYRQTNYYAGGQNGTLPGWSNNTNTVTTYYNEVVREMIGEVAGVENSLPAKYVGGEEYTYTTSLSLEAITFPSFYLTAYIMDNKTGVVGNAKQIKVVDPSGVKDILSNGNVVSRAFYDVNGMEIKDISNGLYIVRSVDERGNVTVKKVIVK